jgi:hypothetical protein
VIVEVVSRSLSRAYAGSTKKVTPSSADWPAAKVCSVKQKHSSLLK